MTFEFDDDGLLKPGTYTADLQGFLDVFCCDELLGSSSNSIRSNFHMALRNIYDWAQSKGATSLVFGGSFVSRKPCPNDIDVLIFFADSAMIPKTSKVYEIDGVMLDIQMLAEDQPDIKSAFLDLLSLTRSGIRHGLVQIKFHQTAVLHEVAKKRSKHFEVVKAAYIGRHIQLQESKGLVIPIHGIQTHADWMPHLTLLASASGWAVAPYVYGYKSINVLRNESEKSAIVEGFRDWIATVKANFDGPISIIAHSFGTYIFARYLQEAKELAVDFDAVIFCGSILNKNYDWKSYLDGAKVGKVLNIVSEEDEWVRFMPEGGVRFIAQDSLFGKAGCEGFSCDNDRITQIRSSLLTHNNVIKSDIINGQWLPFLKLAHGSQERYRFERLRSNYSVK